jgi:hypothetical protein
VKFGISREISLKVGIITGCIVLSVLATFLINKTRVDSKIGEANQAITAAETKVKNFLDQGVQVVKLTREVGRGEVIRSSDIEVVGVAEYISPDNSFHTIEEVSGKIAKIPMSMNTVLTTEMLADEELLDDSARRYEIDYVRLPIKLIPEDKIDILIIFPTGEKQRIITKKKMTSVDLNTQTLFLNLNDEESSLMYSALTDAYINKAELVAVQYPEPELQDEPIKTYFPNQDVIRAIQASPDIKDKARYNVASAIRKSLDERLAAIPEDKKIRQGAELPDGSAVSQRKKTLGAQINVVTPPTENGSNEEKEVSSTPEGFVPAKEDGGVGDK